MGRKLIPITPPVFGQSFEHFIRKIAVMVRQGSAAGMGGNDRGLTDFDHVPEGLFMCMGDVDDHSQSVHLFDNLHPEFSQSCVESFLIS